MSARHHAHRPADVHGAIEWDTQALLGRVSAVAAAAPGKAAIDFYGRVLDFGSFQRAVVALAGYMQQRLEVRRGDRVLLLMPNCPQLCIAQHAVLRCGAVVVAAWATSSASEIADVAADAGASVLVTTQDMLERIELLLAQGRLTGCLVGACSDMAGGAKDVPVVELPAYLREPRRPLTPHERQRGLHDIAGAIEAGIEPMPVEVAPDDLAVIAYTPGTVDQPTNTVLTHRALADELARRSREDLGNEDSSHRVALPLGDIEGLCAFNLALCQGRITVLLSCLACHGPGEACVPHDPTEPTRIS